MTHLQRGSFSMRNEFSKRHIAAAIATALGAAAASAAYANGGHDRDDRDDHERSQGTYVAGDVQNPSPGRRIFSGRRALPAGGWPPAPGPPYPAPPGRRPPPGGPPGR